MTPVVGEDVAAPDSAASRGTTSVEALAINKSYGGPLVVRDVSFELKQGELLTLLGPSGSGKSTTLMMVAGFERPTSGEILVGGQSVLDVPPQRRNLGVVFQSYALFPHMSVLENIAFPLRMRGMGRRARHARAHDMLTRVGLDEFAERRPRHLSGGQQQRVALARALVFEPQALLLDEPLGALDKRLRDQLQLEIKRIHQRTGVSVIYVTHDQSEAMMMSDRIAIMHGGRVEQLGTPTELYDFPATAFVAKFLGETNLLPCDVIGTESGVAFCRLSNGVRVDVRDVASTLRASGPSLVSVRPERVKILDTGETADCTLDGVVATHIFLGAVHRLTVVTLGTEIVLTLPDRSPLPSLSPGQELRVGWGRDDAQLLASEE